ncbi:hypothetical protein NKH77_15950 [Streptomyces sp. M19]
MAVRHVPTKGTETADVSDNNTLTVHNSREHPVTPQLSRGVVVRDTSADRVGEVMDVRDARVFLRPLGGGREWEADPVATEVVPPGEVLHLKVQVANDRSLGRGGGVGP